MGARTIPVSVVVCTYDRADMLERCLLSLVKQTLDRSLFEIIVVDNGSHDDTQGVAQRIQSKHSETNITLVCEPLQGLGHARNAGARAAKGRYVAFIDDDAVAAPDWLASALQAMDKLAPRPMVVGGPIKPLYDGRKPTWFKDEYELRTWGVSPRFLRDDETFSGSNMFLDIQALEGHGGFGVHVGMTGDHVSVGEETHLFGKMRQASGADATFFYTPSSIVYHSVPAKKMTVTYQLGRALIAGYVAGIEASPSTALTIRAVLGALARVVGIGWLFLLRRGEYATRQNWAVEALQPVAARVGWAAGCLRLPLRMKR
jgi:glucosyl-dolichyl phosphate glucuronosyltransferase